MKMIESETERCPTCGRPVVTYKTTLDEMFEPSKKWKVEIQEDGNIGVQHGYLDAVHASDDSYEVRFGKNFDYLALQRGLWEEPKEKPEDGLINLFKRQKHKRQMTEPIMQDPRPQRFRLGPSTFELCRMIDGVAIGCELLTERLVIP